MRDLVAAHACQPRSKQRPFMFVVTRDTPRAEAICSRTERSVKIRQIRPSPRSRRSTLFSVPILHQLDRQPIRPLDHRSTRVAEIVGLDQYAHAAAAQAREKPIEVVNAERDMVQRLAA